MRRGVQILSAAIVKARSGPRHYLLWPGSMQWFRRDEHLSHKGGQSFTSSVMLICELELKSFSSCLRRVSLLMLLDKMLLLFVVICLFVVVVTGAAVASLMD